MGGELIKGKITNLLKLARGVRNQIKNKNGPDLLKDGSFLVVPLETIPVSMIGMDHLSPQVTSWNKPKAFTLLWVPASGNQLIFPITVGSKYTTVTAIERH